MWRRNPEIFTKNYLALLYMRCGFSLITIAFQTAEQYLHSKGKIMTGFLFLKYFSLPY
jgi:hypothetical protein